MTERTDNAGTNDTVTKTAAIPIKGGSIGHLRSGSVSSQNGLLGWFGNLASPSNRQHDMAGPGPGSLGHVGSVDSSASIPAGQDAVQRRRRTDSSSLSHDEALNISRANSGARPRGGESPLEDASVKPRRQSRSSKYEKLGLMAAYSGGPSSF